MTRRSRILAVALALCAEASSGCGGTQVLAPARPRLGVQSNAVVIDAIELRVRPEPGARWIATSEAVGDATVLGQEVHFEYASTSERAVRERRADGTTVLAERRLGGAMRIAMGETPAREEAFAPEPSTRTTVMDARGRTIEDALFAAPAPLEDARTQAMRRALEPIVDAIAYPEHPVAVGERWRAEGTCPVSEGDARGSLRYALEQEVARVEGTGADSVAILRFRGDITGDGRLDADPVTGSLRLEGAYSVRLSDGLVRSMESRVEGNLSLGPVGMPFHGTVRYRAE